LRTHYQATTFAAPCPSLDPERAKHAGDPDLTVKEIFELITHYPAEVTTHQVLDLLVLAGSPLVDEDGNEPSEERLAPLAQLPNLWTQVHNQCPDRHYHRLKLSYTAVLDAKEHPFHAHTRLIRNLYEIEAEIDETEWTLTVEGESCLKPRRFTLAELKAEFEHHTYQLLIECGGNGRSEFNPPATGNQWTVGAVGCPEWTGVRLRDVLKRCGIAEDAVYVGYAGADVHLSGDPKKSPISRGVPMWKALEDETLLAFAMNGEAMPWINGHPLRLVVGGWPASVSGKWLNRLMVRDRVHDGEKMMGSYRVPKYPVQPGTQVPEEDTKIIESMPVKSLITRPQSGVTHERGEPLECRGQAWAGDLAVKEVFVSINYGATWEKAALKPAPNRMCWQRWTVALRFPEIGYYEIWARAVDEKGISQPMIVPGWNSHGYLNNACHRIAVQVV
jgi:DMSO/TMAO reductase YedYZ molybdopterin-dependent catalytic subunit